MISSAQRKAEQRLARLAEADKAREEARAAAHQDAAADLSTMSLSTLLQTVGLTYSHAQSLRANGWETLKELRQANINDMVAANLAPPDARRLLNAVRATCDPRTEYRLGGVGSGGYVTAGVAAQRPHTVAQGDGVTQSSLGNSRASSGGGGAYGKALDDALLTVAEGVSRADAERELKGSMAGGVIRLQETLSRHADAARRNVKQSQVQRDIHIPKLALLDQLSPHTRAISLQQTGRLAGYLA